VTPQRVRAIRHGLLLAGLVVLATVLVGAWLTASETSAGEAYDARAYWEAARGDPYARPVLGAPVAYYYSPAFLQVFGPLLALSFPAFLASWYALNGAALVAVTRSWLPFALLTGFVGLEVLRGNIETLMALAIVAGFRWPAAWAFILLTKVTPGVGLLWFVGRREWRSLAMAVGATAAIAAVSFAIAPALWTAWIASLIANAGVSIPWEYFPVPLLVRLPIAAALALLAGVRNWRWLVPIASTLAMPALWPVNLTLLVAIFPLIGQRSQERGASPVPGAPGAPSQPDAPSEPGSGSRPALEVA
jgi:glycosyl transferase family 87